MSKIKTYLIVDGYNVIHHLAEMEGLTDFNLEEAREDLIEQLNSYSGLMGYETVLVFDAYSQENAERREEIRGRIKVVFTEKNKTADTYIEKLVFSACPGPTRSKWSLQTIRFSVWCWQTAGSGCPPAN